MTENEQALLYVVRAILSRTEQLLDAMREDVQETRAMIARLESIAEEQQHDEEAQGDEKE